MNIMKTLQEYKEYAESQGLYVFSIMLKGSQNYNLDDEESDIDANLIFIPKPSDLRKATKYKFEFDTGDVVCHSIYDFAAIVAKGNPQWIEVCHTVYKIGDPLDIFKHYKVNPSALKGMLMEKVHAFNKLYPSREKYVKKFGYDPKQLHHIIRLYDSLKADDPIYKYSGKARNSMLDIKRGRYPGSLELAEKLRDDYVNKLEKIYEDKKLNYKLQEVNYDLLDLIVLNYYKTI